MNTYKGGLAGHIGQFHKIRVNAKGGSEHCNMPGCSTSFQFPSELKRHLDIHNNTPRFKCPYCQFTAHLGTNFNDHMTAHYGELEYKCNICGHIAKSQSDLKTHIDIHDETKYKCTICSTICSTKKSHKDHVNEHHDIYEEIPKYRLIIQPKVTEKDMKRMFPNRKKNCKTE